MSNVGKYFDFQNDVVLDGPDLGGDHQSLDKLQDLIATETDLVLSELLSVPCVIGGAMLVTAATGLSVSIASGTAFITGQRVAGSPTILPGLTPNATLKIYAQSSGVYSSTVHAWGPQFGFTAGSIPGGALQLATVTTDGSSVTAAVDNRRVLVPLSLLSVLIQGVRDALAGTSGVPSDTNRYVTDSDSRFPTAGELAALAGTHGIPGDTNRYVTDSDSRLTSHGVDAHAPTHYAGGTDFVDPVLQGVKNWGTKIHFGRLMALALS
jgi:hypothetical protein